VMKNGTAISEKDQTPFIISLPYRMLIFCVTGNPL